MTYATVQDCIDRLGAEAVQDLADDRYPGEGEDYAYTRLERALDDASAEIDGYVATRHPLPLDPVPKVLKRLCVEIAADIRAATADLSTELTRERAKGARGTLRDIAAGKLSLGAADPDPPASASDPGVQFESRPSVLDRDSLRGAL